ncbi:hypothetical protein GCM10017774_49330 [Lentzea cavernae]|uniref:T/G mismatch-specific endonuclease n=1 Tax=Lentzea cavernae TaxID=2020703 RepID=A0ABQ3MPD2_9PSEU|nr:hypothetical protein GCM10017774_49330 [Lentzea cavernae]
MFLGTVDEAVRSKNLAQGWRLARDKGLLADEVAESGSWASSAAVRSSMRGNRGKNTGPELRLRALLHRAGLRYRVGVAPLSNVRRTVDVVFPKVKVAVFVDGCFWHGCPAHYRPAATNKNFWRAKIEGNRSRDRETDRLLRDGGWEVIRMWEHEDPEDCASRVLAIVRSRQI